MTLFGSDSRDDLRRAYAEAWRKRLEGAPLTALEALISDVIGLHPEYQAVVRNADAALGFEPTAAAVADNPFLHMGLHIAVREQLSIDRPPGIRELHRRLLTRYADPHAADHVLMESLAQTLWEAQRAGRTPDESHYLELARQQLK